MSVIARLVFATLIAYMFIGLGHATWETIDYQPFAKNPDALAPPWKSPMAFLAWFVLPAVYGRGVSSVFAACLGSSSPVCISRQSGTSTRP